MGLRLDIGDDTGLPSDDLVPVEVNPGDTVTVQNQTGSNATLNYLTSFDAGPAGTIAAGTSQQFTVGPLYLQSQGVSSVLITGGVYGS